MGMSPLNATFGKD